MPENKNMQSYGRYSLKGLFDLDGQVIIVTGAGGQIGGEIVSAALGLGARVVASDANEEVLVSRASGGGWPDEKVLLVPCDIRYKDEVHNLFARGEQEFGAITSLVNNAGVSVFEPFLERDEPSFDWVMDVNLKGTFWCIREFIERSEKAHKGRIVNVASHYGVVSPDPRIYTDCKRRNSEVYGATKAGVIQMTRYFAVHAAEYGINVNAVAPGGVRNPWAPQGDDFQQNYGFRNPMGRMAELDEIPGAVIFLLSRAASYINGQTIAIDGGATAW